MNLLGIQDALKNASDDQLANLIRSPDSTAPSYLVLSELRRREEMRAKQAQAPQTTVAEDLTSEENMQAPMGIRSLSTPEPGDEEYRPEEGDGIQAMREGGIVHMYKGDEVEAKEDGERSRAGQFLDYATGQFGSAVEAAPRVIEGNLEAARRGLGHNPYTYMFGSPSAHTQAGVEQQYLLDNAGRIRSGQFDMNAFRRDPTEYMRANPTGPRAGVNPPAAPTTQPPATQPPTARTESGAPAEELPIPPVPPGAPKTPAGGGAGIRALSGPAAPAPETSSGLPTIAQNMERNLALFPGIPQELLDRIRESRTNEGERRSEARRMALVEAGLRIAASRNPSLAGAIGEGAAPAVQSYNQQLRQIREDQNADLTRDLSVAQADLQRRYMAGQISASELDRQSRMLISNNELAVRMRVAQMQAASAAASAGRNPQLELLRAVQADPALGEAHARMNGRDPEARAEGRLATQATAVNGSINAIRQLLADPTGTLTDAERAEYRSQLTELLQTSRSLRSRMGGGLGGSLTPGENGAPPIYQLPGR
jgi:hypothetical protein